MSKEFLGFLAVGIFAAGINILARLQLSQIMIYEAAVAVAYVVAFTVAFALNRRFVFADKNPKLIEQFGKFAVVNIAAFVQVWVISVGLVRFVFPALGFTWHAETIGHIAGVASPVLTSFLFYKHWIFDKVME